MKISSAQKYRCKTSHSGTTLKVVKLLDEKEGFCAIFSSHILYRDDVFFVEKEAFNIYMQLHYSRLKNSL